MNPASALTLLAPEALVMIGMVTLMFAVMKGLVLWQWRDNEGGHLPDRRTLLLFLAPWPGMNPAAFVRTGAARPRWLTWGAAGAGAGLALLALAHVLTAIGIGRFWVALAVMPGFSLFLHFGMFTLLTWAYRRAGYAVGLPFGNPLRARSLEKFWGHLWNRPFIELTASLVLRPLRARGVGRTAAVFAGFMVSGLLHELAITVPAGGGYGGPTLYFLLQGLGWTWEQRLTLRGLVARGWTWAWILIPLPLVFPAEFAYRVMFPLAGLTGGAP